MAEDTHYATDNRYGPKSISRDMRYASAESLERAKTTYAPDNRYGPPVSNAPEPKYIVARGESGANDKDAHGNAKRYKLSGALALITTFFLESFAGTFIRNILNGAYFDRVWPSLPIRDWTSAGFAFFSNAMYVGLSVELPPIPPPQPPPPSLDTTPPVVTSFTMPVNATSKSVAITTFTATDNDGVIGYQVTEGVTPPEATGLWYTEPLTRFVFASYGTNSAFAWALDKSGNVSNYQVAVVDCVEANPPETWEPMPPPPPRMPCEVVAFTMGPIDSSNRRVNVINFDGQSWLSINGYLITDSTVPPLANDSRWSVTKPTYHTFPADGEQTAYAWVKDLADDVSSYRSFTVTVWAEGVPTYAKVLTMDHGFNNPYGSTTQFVKYLDPVGFVYASSRWYGLNKYIQLTKTWDHGETEQGTITLEGDPLAPDTFWRGGYSTSATPYIVPADDGRVIAFNTATEEYIMVGAPDFEILPMYGGTIGTPKMTVAPLLPAQGRPTNNGYLYYCDGDTGAYMGGDDVLYAFTFTTWYVPVYNGSPYSYTYKHIFGDARHTYYERAGVTDTLPSNFTLLSADIGLTNGRHSTDRFREYFLNDKPAVLAALVARGRRPMVASNVHDASYSTGYNGQQTNCVVVNWLAICTGKIPNGAYGDITIDGVRSLSLISYAVNKSSTYDGVEVTPALWPIHYPTAYPTCQLVSGLYGDGFAFLTETGVESVSGLQMQVTSMNIIKFLGGNIAVATVSGYPDSETVLTSTTEYLQKGTIKWFQDNPGEYACPHNPPPSTPHTYNRKTHPQGVKNWSVYTTDRGLTWNRLTPAPGMTEGELSANLAGMRTLNGDDLAVIMVDKELYQVGFASGSLTLLDPYGYDSTGTKIQVQGRVWGLVGNTNAANGEIFFVTRSEAGDWTNPQAKYFISTSTTTIETHGPTILTVTGVLTFGPDYGYEFTGATIGGYANNVVTLTNPLPHPNTIVMLLYTTKIAGQRRLLLLSDFGSTVYDAGWVEESFNGEMLIDTFAGGGFDPAFAGDIAYPYIPPVYMPLEIVSPPVLGPILGAVEGEYLQIEVQGGRFPYNFTVTAGALPTGMAMDPVGYIIGVATIGSYSFTIQVVDNEGTIVSQAFTCEVV